MRRKQVLHGQRRERETFDKGFPFLKISGAVLDTFPGNGETKGKSPVAHGGVVGVL